MGTIALELADLQAIHAGITGILNAPIARPASIPVTECPMVLLRPGGASITAAARDLPGSTVSYEGMVAVTGLNSGRGIEEGIARTHAILDTFRARYAELIGSDEVLSTSGSVVTGYTDSGEGAAEITWGEQ